MKIENIKTSKNVKVENIEPFKNVKTSKNVLSKHTSFIIFAELVHNQNGCGIIMGLNKVQSLGSGI